MLLVSLSCSLILGGCGRNSPAPTPAPLNFDLEALLLDPSSLPGWRVSDGPDTFAYEQGQEESQYIRFVKKDFKWPGAIHTVFLYRDEEYAADNYEQYLSAHFESAFRLTSWKVPDELNYQSPVADQFQFACANFQNTSDTSKTYTKCVAMGQYERVVSVFSTYISPDAMSSYSELENVLKAIDERMAAYLKPS